MTLRAMTLTQPWAGLVASGIKLIENRPRRMVKPSDFGTPFAIHASRVIDDTVYQRIRAIAPEVIADVRIVNGQMTSGAPWFRLSRLTSSVIGVATIDRELHGWDDASITQYRLALGDSQSLGDQLKWFFGPVGYVLRDVIALPEPVECKGALGFWTLSDDVERKVRAQLEKAGKVRA